MTKLIAGTGNYVYEVVRPWGELPDGMDLGGVSHVGVDSHDRVYAFQRKDPPVVISTVMGSTWVRGAPACSLTPTA